METIPILSFNFVLVYEIVQWLDILNLEQTYTISRMMYAFAKIIKRELFRLYLNLILEIMTLVNTYIPSLMLFSTCMYTTKRAEKFQYRLYGIWWV